jgi:hypothetical protein
MGYSIDNVHGLTTKARLVQGEGRRGWATMCFLMHDLLKKDKNSNMAKHSAHKSLQSLSAIEAWPNVPSRDWLETCSTIHMWTQIVGKIRLARAPMMNHWWQATFYVTTRGFTTSPIPDDNRTFQIDFDFIDHLLIITTSDGKMEQMPLQSQPLPEFYQKLFTKLSALGINVPIWPVPVETIEAVPFLKDQEHFIYDPDIALLLMQLFIIADKALTEFRSGFIGKASPVHLFWGSFDLAATRFSGRMAPPHPGGIPHLPNRVTREAYSHEVSSCGFWPGTKGIFERPAFYAYAYPEPAGFAQAKVRPQAATYSDSLHEFLLPYDDICTAPDPTALLREFLQDTYEAAANLGKWQRRELERI